MLLSDWASRPASCAVRFRCVTNVLPAPAQMSRPDRPPPPLLGHQHFAHGARVAPTWFTRPGLGVRFISFRDGVRNRDIPFKREARPMTITFERFRNRWVRAAGLAFVLVSAAGAVPAFAGKPIDIDGWDEETARRLVPEYFRPQHVVDP